MSGEHTSRREVRVDDETKLVYYIHRWEHSRNGFEKKYRIGMHKYERRWRIITLGLTKKWKNTESRSTTVDSDDFTRMRAKDELEEFREQLVEGKNDPLDNWLDDIVSELEDV